MKAKFSATFWTANIIELFERAAYYAIASFMVIYLNENLGMTPTRATFLNGTLLWGLVYFLPILSGTLADQFGFKKSLVFAFILISGGYLIMGTLQVFWPGVAGSEATVIDYTIPVILGIFLIGTGGSFIKPCIAGTVQKTSAANTALGFSIFYMIINIGSITGRAVSYVVRNSLGIPAIFTYVAAVFAFIGLIISIFIFHEPQNSSPESGARQNHRTIAAALFGMITVIKNLKFVFFIIVIGFYWIIYVQIYNLIPLYLRFVDKNAPVELYTLMNPLMIVCLQLVVTGISKNLSAVKSIMAGVAVTVAGMLVNIVPALLHLDPGQKIAFIGLPTAGLFILLSIAAMAIGEMLASPRIYQYIGAIAPKGQEGLYLGYANLPIALGTIVGAPLGGILFTFLIKNPAKNGTPTHESLMWFLVALMGLVSLGGLYLYDRFLMKTTKKQV